MGTGGASTEEDATAIPCVFQIYGLLWKLYIIGFVTQELLRF